MSLSKTLLYQTDGMSSSVHRSGAQANVQARTTEDFQTGVDAF